MKYYDKNNKEIKAGMYIKHCNGDVEKVCLNDNEDDLGVNATNEDYVKNHSYIGIGREIYPLSQFNTSEWEILDEISLSEKEIISAINNEDKFALSKLFLDKYNEVVKMGGIIDNFYYSYYVSCSSGIFDMFALKGLESLLDYCGYSFKEEADGLDEDTCAFGHMIVEKNNFSFKMKWEEAMHDSFYSNFVDAKTAEVL